MRKASIASSRWLGIIVAVGLEVMMTITIVYKQLKKVRMQPRINGAERCGAEQSEEEALYRDRTPAWGQDRMWA